MTRAPTVPERPEGLLYRPDFISEPEEHEIVAVLEAMEFHEVTMRGQTARRTVRHFGFDYDYENWRLAPAEPLPASLAWVRNRCAELAEVEQPEELAQALVSRYPPGATIGWHRDAPMFGSPVIGVSLLSACRMRFQRSVQGVRRLHELDLAPRSAYVLAGAARAAWQHSIPPTKSLRYSITFRTLKNPSRWTDRGSSKAARDG